MDARCLIVIGHIRRVVLKQSEKVCENKHAKMYGPETVKPLPLELCAEAVACGFNYSRWSHGERR
jgi:hypothetical protein